MYEFKTYIKFDITEEMFTEIMDRKVKDKKEWDAFTEIYTDLMFDLQKKLSKEYHKDFEYVLDNDWMVV